MLCGRTEATLQAAAAELATTGGPDVLPVDDFAVREGWRLIKRLDVQPRPTIHETRYAVELLDRFLASLTAADIQYLATLR